MPIGSVIAPDMFNSGSTPTVPFALHSFTLFAETNTLNPDIALSNLNNYMLVLKNYNGAGNVDEVKASQDYYCHNQQQNPHTPNVMKSLGLDEADVEKFCTDMLFPKIV